MRIRVAALTPAVVACVCAAVPSIASAHGPVLDRAITIHNTPALIGAGEPVLIYGRLQGRDSADQQITLYHRINPQARFTVIGRTTTDGSGRYEFTRAEGIVQSNRSWFVVGPIHSHSKTVHERVSAEVTLTPSTTESTTRHPLTFAGQVTPGHVGQLVKLQAQKGSTNGWHTIATGRLDSTSAYSIPFGWRIPGPRDVRAVFGADPRNTRGISAVGEVVIDQSEVPGFSISSSDPLVANATPTTISGTLSEPGSTAPEAGASVDLYSRTPGEAAFTLAQTTTTGTDGSYSFTVQSSANELYQARTAFAPRRHSAVVFQGVQDAVTIAASASMSTVGGTVTFTGNVAPGKPGDAVYLEKLGRDGNWHVVKSTVLDPRSDYSIDRTFGTPGDKQFRVQALGDQQNVTGVSATVPVSVSLPPETSLPQGG